MVRGTIHVTPRQNVNTDTLDLSLTDPKLRTKILNDCNTLPV